MTRIDPSVTVLVPPLFAESRDRFEQKGAITMKPRTELPNQDPPRGPLEALNVDDESGEPQKDEGGGQGFDQHLIRPSYHSECFGIEVTGV